LPPFSKPNLFNVPTCLFCQFDLKTNYTDAQSNQN
jgi:hypothetical protein